MRLATIVVRWIARSLGALMILVLVLFAVVEGLRGPSHLTVPERLMFAATATMIIGLIASWKWEGAGAIITLSGFIAFWLIDGDWPGWFFGLIALVGLLHLGCWLFGYRQPLATSHTSQH